MSHEFLIAAHGTDEIGDGAAAPPVAVAVSEPALFSYPVEAEKKHRLIAAGNGPDTDRPQTLLTGFSGLAHAVVVALMVFTGPADTIIANPSSDFSIEIVADAPPPEPEAEAAQTTEQVSEAKIAPQEEAPIITAAINLLPEPAPVVLPEPRSMPTPVNAAKTEPQKVKKKPDTAPRQPRDSNGNVEQSSARMTTAPPSYLGQISAMLHRAKVYPQLARERGEQGRAVVRFTIVRSGNASGAVIVQSSGYRDLDLAASSVIARAGPFPPLPVEYALPALSVTVPIEYSLR